MEAVTNITNSKIVVFFLFSLQHVWHEPICSSSSPTFEIWNDISAAKCMTVFNSTLHETITQFHKMKLFVLRGKINQGEIKSN